EKNRTGWRCARGHASLAPPVEYADEGKEPPRRVEINLDLAGEPVHQRLRAFVMQSAPAHVDRFDLAGGRGSNGLVITLADEEVVLDDCAERSQRQHMRYDRAAIFTRDAE